MTGHFNESGFIPLNIAVLTVSDSRTRENDTSGDSLNNNARDAGHNVVERCIVPDDIYQMRAIVSQWIADTNVHVIISTGGTGITGRDSTPEALIPLFDKSLDGFGELFRTISLDDIGTSAIQSRAFSGLANGTLVFCLPGSTGACRTGWDGILKEQLDHRTRPCNFAQMFPRLLEK
ncbi:MAG: molybdenum cofactor biosynthesis protein B [Candidatus Polarisedimenticolaceae bacterium]|nr:molybdenum cofactor biosynthesis protein B [Candidatus Polarisedimenticolaceae bacterium]